MAGFFGIPEIIARINIPNNLIKSKKILRNPPLLIHLLVNKQFKNKVS